MSTMGSHGTPPGGQDLQAWVGRTETLTDIVTAAPVMGLSATLGDRADVPANPGDPLPPLWVWIYFLPIVSMAQVGPDGHPKRGGFLPPIALERRMWAGGRLTFHAPIRVGDRLEKTSTILKVSEKSGRSGTMVFLTVRHEIRVGGALAVDEEQDIVYLAIPETFSPPPATPVPDGAWREPVTMDPVKLFRFSALTFNGHRIHYDRPYAMDVEKYPGLVVHGPLQALMLFEAGRRRHPGRTPAGFTFRGMRPLFDFDAITLTGAAREDGGLDLYTANGDGAVGMQAALSFTS
ncbi:MAG: MaoC family dehydratase N-terminal domain-containing protein [Alphaproteobacteria bacterium]